MFTFTRNECICTQMKIYKVNASEKTTNFEIVNQPNRKFGNDMVISNESAA